PAKCFLATQKLPLLGLLQTPKPGAAQTRMRVDLVCQGRRGQQDRRTEEWHPRPVEVWQPINAYYSIDYCRAVRILLVRSLATSFRSARVLSCESTCRLLTQNDS